jgi:hypothetical protein
VAWLAQTIRMLLVPLPDEQRAQCLSVMKRKLDSAQADYRQMTFPGLPPEQSDLMAGEVQEAFDTVARTVEKALGILTDDGSLPQ